MKEIPLKPLKYGFVALVDDADFEMLSEYSWGIQRSGGGKLYAITVKRSGATRIRKRMHLLVFGITDKEVDHRDGNGLNNQRDNLRPANRSQQCFNQLKNKAARTSRFKGVSWNSAREQWVAQIQVGRSHPWLGRFEDEKMAAMVYDQAALKYFGEFAKINKMLGLL